MHARPNPFQAPVQAVQRAGAGRGSEPPTRGGCLGVKGVGGGFRALGRGASSKSASISRGTRFSAGRRCAPRPAASFAPAPAPAGVLGAEGRRCPPRRERASGPSDGPGSDREARRERGCLHNGASALEVPGREVGGWSLTDMRNE